MKICFVHLGREHLGIEYLSSVLRRGGHSVTLAYDPGIFGSEDNVFHSRPLRKLFDRRKEVLRTIYESGAQVYAFSVYSSTYQWALEIAREIRPRVAGTIVFGGPHATLAPETVMENECVDCCVVGEGEGALLELADSLARGDRRTDIRNVWFRENGRIIRNPLRPPLPDLDGLPLPDKKLFEREVNYGDDYCIVTSRGCLYRCSYCCESYMHGLYGGGYYRRRSVDSVLRELTVMGARYRFKAVMFNDPVFFNDRVWFLELMRRYRAEVGLPFRCFGKARFIDEEITRVLKESGCYCVEFGLQTLNEEIRARALNRTESNESVERAFDTCDRGGLRYDVDHIFGIPGETIGDHLKAIGFYAARKRLNRIKCHYLTFFPGLDITETCRARGELSPDDARAIREGRTGTFFHGDAARGGGLRDNRMFVAWMKILPVMPRALTAALLARRRYSVFRWMPPFVVLFGQLLAALKGRDYRYLIYLRYYPLRMWRRFVA